MAVTSLGKLQPIGKGPKDVVTSETSMSLSQQESFSRLIYLMVVVQTSLLSLFLKDYEKIWVNAPKHWVEKSREFSFLRICVENQPPAFRR